MPSTLAIFRAALASAVLALPSSALAQDHDVSVVLVHGAFADGSSWARVIPILQEAGISTSAAQLTLGSIADDAEIVSRLVDQQGGPVVLVGHSYGGAVITEAGTHDQVEALVYVAGFAFEAGETLNELASGEPDAPWEAELRPDAAGFLRMSTNAVIEYFAHDLPASEAAVIAATQGPFNYAILDQAPSMAAWTVKPTSYVLASEDRIIPPELQAFFAERMGAETTVLATSHVPMLSQPEAVAQVIMDVVSDLSTE